MGGQVLELRSFGAGSRRSHSRYLDSPSPDGLA